MLLIFQFYMNHRGVHLNHKSNILNLRSLAFTLTHPHPFLTHCTD